MTEQNNKKDEDVEEEMETNVIGMEKLPVLATGFSLDAMKRRDSDEVGDFFQISFIYVPPEASEHTHIIVSRISFDWEHGEYFVSKLQEFINEYKRPKKGKPKELKE